MKAGARAWRRPPKGCDAAPASPRQEHEAPVGRGNAHNGKASPIGQPARPRSADNHRPADPCGNASTPRLALSHQIWSERRRRGTGQEHPRHDERSPHLHNDFVHGATSAGRLHNIEDSRIGSRPDQGCCPWMSVRPLEAGVAALAVRETTPNAPATAGTSIPFNAIDQLNVAECTNRPVPKDTAGLRLSVLVRSINQWRRVRAPGSGT
jgi:hypothetical protein